MRLFDCEKSSEPKGTLQYRFSMNILHLSAAKTWGGGEKHIENLCREMKVIAPEVRHSIFCSKDSDFIEAFRKQEVEVIPATLDFKMDPRYFLKLINICKNREIDILHIHDSTALTLAIMGSYFGNLPPFIFSKKTSFPIQSRRATRFKYNFHKIKKILCVSEATKAIAEENIIDKQKIICVYHGTSLKDKTTANSFCLKKHLNLREETLLIGNIANHIWPKSLRTFILVADELINKQKQKNLHFIQIGAFSKRTPQLFQKVKQLGLTSHVSFLNKIPEASGFIPQFEISLMTSEIEGIPQFIYESFYYKIPVVSTNVGGIPEVIQHEKNGFLAPAFDHKRLAENIKLLLNNKELKKKFTDISKEKLHSNFTSEKMAIQTLEEYKKVLNGRP